ncbi:MAG: lytic transglycosylase domain-containing protein [Aquificae bacterium]|nr:lytic transglycosylase domain-containing protein [Aquificota bacterium]
MLPLALSLLLLVSCTPKTKQTLLKRPNVVVIKEGNWLLSARDFAHLDSKAVSFGVYNLKRSEVELALKELLKKKEALKYAFMRMRMYEPLILPVLKEHNLPQELKYLPVVESMYNPFAVSRSGAAGIWQLMPTTARRYGLKVSREIDERFDPLKSTLAASRYLRDLFDEFKNLELVLAAYNCGEGCVKRRAKGDFWKNKNKLPAETRRYVPLFFAVLHIAKNPEKFGIEVPPAPSPPRRFTLKEKTPVDALLSLYRIKEETFRDLNPHIRGDTIPPGTNVYIEESKTALR